MRQKNEKFASNVRAGKPAVQPSTRDRLKKKSPIGYTAVAVLVFVLAGAGTYDITTLVAQLLTRPAGILQLFKVFF